MNIEKSIEILKKFRNYNKFYKEENKDLTITITLEAKESIDKAIERLLTTYEKEKEKNKEYNMKINNLISQIENAIDFMKTDKSKVKVDMYQQKEEDLKLEIVHLKKILKEE